MSLHRLLAFALCLSLACSASSSIPFQPKYINYTHMQCLQSRGLLDEFFIEGELESTEEFKFFISSVEFEGLDTYSLQPHFNITLASLHFYVPVERTASYYATTLQDYYYKMLWFDIANTEDEITCAQLWTFLSTIGTLTRKPIGIIGNKQEWVEKFGSEESCSQFSIYPLFYSGSQPFESFGGWSTYLFGTGEGSSSCEIDYDEITVMRGEGLNSV